MSGIVDDTFAGPLAERLKAISVADVIAKGLDVAAGEARDDLDAKATEIGYFDVADALRISKPEYYTRVVGVDSRHKAYLSARDMEYGSTDHEQPPHGVFRLYQQTFALGAGTIIAETLERLIAP